MNRSVFAWLLCLSLVFGLCGSAFGEEAAEAPVLAAEAPAAAPAAREGILDEAALTKMVEDYLEKKGVPKDRVGIGYAFPATGDEFFYHPDTWFYPGSMYKVPLMMRLSEKLKNGEVEYDTMIGGLPLGTVFEYILVYSNNDYAHHVRTFLGGDEVWREEVKEYANIDKYDERYMLYCYFSPRYMTRVLETLYNESGRFPDVLDCLRKAEQGHYFRLPDEMHAYDIAQKYGSYLDQENSNWLHNAGIVYTPNPFILTVMTKNVGGAENLIADLAVLFKNYTLELDGKLDAFRAEQERQEAERLAALEAERLAAEQAAAPTPTGRKAAAPSQPTGQPQTQLPTITPDRELRGHKAGIITLSILLAAAIIGGIGAVIIVKERERRRYESFRRRFEAEMRQEQAERRAQAQRQTADERPAPAEQRRRESAPIQRVRRPPQPQRSELRQPSPRPARDTEWLDDEDEE